MRQRILGRLSDGLRRQDWAGVAIDFAIVVLGVFVGIQASNLNSSRIDRALSSEYLERIEADLNSIITTAQNQRRFERIKSSEVVAALAMTQQQPTDEKSLRLGHLLTAITSRLSPNFESPTFSEIQSSGRLSLIKDTKLRMQVSAYFARLQYLRSAIGRNNDSYAESFADFLRREGVGAGFAEPDTVSEVAMSDVEERISALLRARFGRRDIRAHSSALGLPPSHPFWERLRANLTWRGVGAVANENLLNMMVADASKMSREIQRQRTTNR